MQDSGTTSNDWKSVFLAKTEIFVFGVQVWKSWVSAYGWMGSATLNVAAPKCRLHKMAQPNSQENAGSPNFGLHINKKIKKTTKSREFGPVT